jgi:hypothetical protein
MPRDGAIIFSDLIGKLDSLRVSCEKCGRDGCYGLSRLIEKRGRDGKLIDWLDELTAECPNYVTMTTLLLSPTRKYFGIGDENDYVVLDGGRVIGRIFLQPQAPEGRPWFWTITAPDILPSIDKRGYSATREQSMADFKHCG